MDNTIEKQAFEAFRNSSVLITGAAGMVSRNAIRVIQRINREYGLGISVIAHVLDQTQADCFFSKPVDGVDISVITGDIRTLQVEGPVDYIIHTAGITGGSKQHIDFPMTTISVAIDGTRQVLEIAKEKKTKAVVYLSSLEIYGKSPDSKESICETDGGYIDPVNVRSSYSESKRMCENICASYTKQFGVPCVIARLTATFGYGVSIRDNRVFAQFARSVMDKQDIVLKSTGGTVRNYCDAEDTASALLWLLAKGTPGEAYNIANMDTEISIKDMAELFISMYPESGISLKFDIQEDATRLGYNAEMRNVLNSQKLMDLGWRPRYDMKDMINHLVDAMNESKKLEA